MNPQHYHRKDLRERLIRTAEKLIAEQGVEAVTMRMLSQRIGVSHTAAYRHFRDKQELLHTLSENGFKELARRLQALSSEPPRPSLDLIRAQGQAYIDFALENPSRYRIMFGPLLRQNRDAPALKRAVRDAFTPLVRAIEQGRRTGAVRSGDPVELAAMAWSTVHGFSQLVLDGRLQAIMMDETSTDTSNEAVARLAHAALDAAVGGLMPDRRDGRAAVPG